ncbi:MAG: beta-phosphoglucomutase [Christensenellaceae bacterium]|nr:beta-phosphoglucomutase [Christensenellaceae bacterium]
MKAVIFDLDGVLVSTDEYHFQAWKQLANEENIYFDRKINERLRGVSRMDSLEIILERSRISYRAEEKKTLASRKNGYYISNIENLTPNDMLPGALVSINRLKEAGKLIAIGSSSKNTLLILEKLGIKEYFDAIVDGNQIKNSKPDPEVFLLGAEKMNVKPEECLVVEDAASGVEAGKSAGMKVLGVGSAKNHPLADYRANSLAGIDILKFV